MTKYAFAYAPGGGDGSLANPFNTFGAAQNAIADGEEIVIDGVFVGSAAQSGSQLWPNLTKSCTIRSLSPYSGWLVTGNTTAGLGIASASFAGAVVVKDIVVAGSSVAGGVNPNSNFLDSSTAAHSVTFAGTRFLDTTFFAINFTGTNAIPNLTISNLRWDSSTGRSVLQMPSAGATAAITIDGISVPLVAKSHNSFLINVVAAVQGATFSATNMDLNWSNTITGNNLHGAVFVANINNVRITKSKCRGIGANGGASAYGFQVDCNSGSLTAHNALIEDCYGYIEESTGVVFLGGHDVTSVGDHRCNNHMLRNLKAEGGLTFRNQGHGVMLGNNTAGQEIDCESINCGISALSKQTIDSCITNPTCRGFGTSAVYFKGAVRARSIGAMIYQAEGNGPSFQAKVGDPSAGNPNNADCYFAAAQIELVGACSRVAEIAASQGVTLIQSVYYVAPGATVSSPAMTINGTDYATVAAGLAIADANAKVISNASMPANYAQPRSFLMASSMLGEPMLRDDGDTNMYIVNSGSTFPAIRPKYETDLIYIAPADAGGTGYAQVSYDGGLNYRKWRPRNVISKTSIEAGRVTHVRFVCLSGQLVCGIARSRQDVPGGTVQVGIPV